MEVFQLLIALNDFKYYHAKMYDPYTDRRDLVAELADVEDQSRYLVLEAIPEFREFTVWEADAWYEKFKDWDHENYG